MIALLTRNAKWLDKRFTAVNQLLMWVALFWLCFPLYFVTVAVPGSVLSRFIYVLSVVAVHITAALGIPAALNLIEQRPNEEL